ncbi:MAG: sialate O-acetylesterase, partial [Candidatus Aminicenantes bacterium RBG_16_66_30]
MASSMKRSATLALATALALGMPLVLAAQVRLPAVIGDHMVIQQDKPVTIWGWAGKAEPVTVLFNGQEKRAVAAADGTWRVVFDPLKAGDAPLAMTVRGAKGPEVVVKDILVGEVWLCSGQSNMEMSMSWLRYPSPDALRADNPNMRLFLVPKRTADRPMDDVAAKWEPCTPDAVRPFSAVAYYFGVELHKRLGVPVGLIESAWGGTDIEPWTPPVGFAAVPEVGSLLEKQTTKYAAFRDALAKALPAWETWVRESRKALAAKSALPLEPKPDFPPNPYDNPQAPTTLYNGMI